ncbi:tyrosine-type recombinase/integrase [Mesorhizobium sp. M0514]|uniref:tyrosine-type recombinase/integrase n=1 Tax=Mesorhizobium sp. M0514 TaxID=2956955 RepID=UPI00333AEDE8
MFASRRIPHRPTGQAQRARCKVPADGCWAAAGSGYLLTIQFEWEWVRVLGKTSLPRIRFHDLRHTHASQMLSAGVHPKVASERLGHSTIGITLDLYSHVMPGMQADAAEQVDVALQAAISSERKGK